MCRAGTRTRRIGAVARSRRALYHDLDEMLSANAKGGEHGTIAADGDMTHRIATCVVDGAQFA
jgi:hypothetical protein